MPPDIEVAGRRIGPGHPCFVIAEAGVNHNGDRDLAHRLIDAAADAGADAVKFQTWITELLCQPGARPAQYQQTNVPSARDQFAMLKELELPYEWHAELQAHARRRGLLFLSTPDEIQSARFLCELGVPAIKIGSGEVTNLPYLASLARLGKPLILSTGMSSLEEVKTAVATMCRAAPVPFALLHCVSAYPAPEAELNLKAIVTLRETFSVPAGLSDHTTATLAAAVAVGLEMALYEKHLTVDRSLPGPDHAASANPEEFAATVRAIRRAEAMLGSGVKSPTPAEAETRRTVRRVLFYARDLASGHVLRLEDLSSLRSDHEGLPPARAFELEGRRLRIAVRRQAQVAEVDLQ